MPLNYTARETAATVLTTEMNSKTSGSLSDISASQDNDTAGVRNIYGQAEIYLAAQGTNRAAGAYVALYFVPELDGTNFGDTTDECLDNYFVGSASFDDAALAARRVVIDRVRFPVGDFKVIAKNGTGQTWASSGNTVKLRAYTFEDAT